MHEGKQTMDSENEGYCGYGKIKERVLVKNRSICFQIWMDLFKSHIIGGNKAIWSSMCVHCSFQASLF